MRLVVHDYSGHPGQVHLSRELARRGHTVQHQFCASYITGRGAVEVRGDDPSGFSVEAINLNRDFAQYSPLTRLRQEIQYAHSATRAILRFKPDAVLLCNVPLAALILIASALRLGRLPYVFWQQDIYSNAIGAHARAELGILGLPLGWIAAHAEKHVARGASSVVAISDTFTGQLNSWGVPSDKVHVVPNWAAIDEMPIRPQSNDWADRHGLSGSQVVMYAGTLGIKHNPALLADLARSSPKDTRTVVVSQGRGRDWLEAESSQVDGLILLDYQPYEVLPEMLACASVLVVLLEQDASRYSVPSKVLNYLCAGRPILALVPGDNLVARTIEKAQAGLVVDPSDAPAVASALNQLLSSSAQREQMGRAAREYAERAFDVRQAGNWFEAIVSAAAAGRTVAPLALISTTHGAA